MSVDKTFVNAMCISRQKYLLGKDKLARLLECADFDEAFRMVQEYGFGEGDVAPSEYERVLLAEQVKLYDFVRSYAPTEAIKTFLLAPKDCYNAEYLLRRAHVSLPDLPLVAGTVSVDRIKKGVQGAYNLLPSYLVEPVKEAEALFERGQATGVAVSTVFARALYAHLLSVCKGRRIRGYVQWQIDAKNVSVALRSGSRAEIENMYIEGGLVALDSLLLLQKGERTAIERRFTGTEYAEVVRLALEAKEHGLPLIAYENAVDSAFLRSLYAERYSCEGDAPFLLYFGYKTNDIQNVRLILAGKLARADKDSIKARLRVSYGE